MLLTFFVFCDRANYGQIINCVNNGNITITVTSQDMVLVFCHLFGIHNYGTIINCINHGNINMVGIPSSSGITAFSLNNDGSGKILNCINTGDINVKRTDEIGIFTCVNFGTIKNCMNTGRLIGEGITGGIAGDCINQSIIENCLNTNYASGNSETGGIVGKFNCNYSGNITVRNNLNISKINGYALFGNTDTIYQNPNLILENNFYDKQMVTQEATIINDIPENNAAKGVLTTQITGFSLQEILGNGWSYAEGR